MDCIIPGFSVFHSLWSLLKFMFIESMMLSISSSATLFSFAFNLSQHQGIFQWDTSSHLKKKMATHSTVLAWRIPETAEPGGLPSIGSHRVGHNWSDAAAAAAAALYITWPKYWSFSISPSNEYSWLISFRINWFDLLVVQGTLKSLLQNQDSKASILQCAAFLMVKLSCPYMTWLLEKP